MIDLSKLDDLTADDYQDAINLTHKQDLAFNALKRAVKRCEETGVYFYQVLETTYALNGNNVRDVVGTEERIHEAACLQYLGYPSIKITDGWADDSHYIILHDDYQQPDGSEE